MIQQTSIDSYNALRSSSELGRRQLEVLRLLRRNGAMSNRMIAFELGLNINQVTGRTKELRDAGFVREHSRSKEYHPNPNFPSTNRTVLFWEAI